MLILATVEFTALTLLSVLGRCRKAVVKDPGQYHFNPDKMLADVCEFLLQLGKNQSFRDVLAAEQDFDAIGFDLFEQVAYFSRAIDQEHIFENFGSLRCRMLGLAGKKEAACLQPLCFVPRDGSAA